MEELPKAVNKMKVMQVATYNVADSVIEIPRKGQGNLVIQAGQPLPDRWDEDFDVNECHFCVCHQFDGVEEKE